MNIDTTPAKRTNTSIDEFLYKDLVKAPEVVPQCSCPGTYSFNGLQVTESIKSGRGIVKQTKANKDGETCVFCDHYVVWAPIKKGLKKDNKKEIALRRKAFYAANKDKILAQQKDYKQNKKKALS